MTNINNILNVVQKYDEYAEYGHTYHDEEIIIADWNKVPDKLERYLSSSECRIETGWSDQYIMDDHGLYHYTDDHTYVIWDCDVVSIDDMDNDNLREYIQSELTDNPNNAIHIPTLVDKLPEIAVLMSFGHENGHYAGMNDNPADIMKAHKDYGRDTLFFALSDQTPFRVEFQLWQLKDNEQ